MTGSGQTDTQTGRRAASMGEQCTPAHGETHPRLSIVRMHIRPRSCQCMYGSCSGISGGSASARRWFVGVRPAVPVPRGAGSRCALSMTDQRATRGERPAAATSEDERKTQRLNNNTGKNKKERDVHARQRCGTKRNRNNIESTIDIYIKNNTFGGKKGRINAYRRLSREISGKSFNGDNFITINDALTKPR